MALLSRCRNPGIHREIALRQGFLSAKAVGDEGKAVRIPKSTGCRDIALEPRRRNHILTSIAARQTPNQLPARANYIRRRIGREHLNR